MMSSVIGGAMLPHTPQFFTMPETEDRDTVERVKTAAAEIGTRLRALRPDLWIIFANDHVEEFFHTAAPPFAIHVGAEAKGEFAGRRFHWRVPGEIGFEIVRQMYAQGFDPAFTSVAKINYVLGIPLTHLEITDPVLPFIIDEIVPQSHRYSQRGGADVSTQLWHRTALRHVASSPHTEATPSQARSLVAARS